MAARLMRWVARPPVQTRALCAFRRTFVNNNKSTDNEIDLDNFKNNPYFDKYKQKLERAKKEGVKIQTPKKKSRLVTTPSSTKNKTRGAQARPSEPKGNPGIKSLDDIVNLDLIKELPTEAIEELWKERHREIDCVGACIPVDVYNDLKLKAKECPMFIYPVPREEGIEFFLSQWFGHQCAFTSLLEYKVHQSEARPYLLLNHYTELAESKGIVLMNGDVDDKINVADAQMLSYQLQLFYLGGKENYQLVKDFNLNPQEFDYRKAVDRLDRMQMKAAEARRV
eukprot:m.20624 g.20624  ORF g.20624 m.20624 type:complete len:282 (+) comp6903_c0_seq1:20-865(+)